MESGSPPPPQPPLPSISSPPPKTSPPPPPPPTSTFQDPIVNKVKNVKTICRLFMVTNLGIAAYALLMPLNKEDPVVEEKKAPEPENPLPLDFDYDQYIVPASASSELPTKPLSEDQQRELFEWMLEEKRNIKPRNREEKKRINEEKAVLKQFIRADSIRPF